MTFTVSARWAVVLLALPVTWLVARGVRDLGEYSAHSRDLDEATAAVVEADIESSRLYGRLEVKLAIAQEYATGRITMRAAARQFLALSDDEKTLAALRRAWPTADDDEERCAASVVRYLRTPGDEVQPTTPEYRRAVADFAREYGSSVGFHAVP